MKKFIIQKFLSAQNILADEVAFRVRRDRVIHDLNKRNHDSTESIVDNNQNGLTVSLTTFGRRIKDVYLAIESIGVQTLKPGRVILWLTDGEFQTIPNSLKKLEKRGLLIGHYKDIKAYKKLIPSLKNFPNDIIITIDDDVVYNRDLVEVLYNSYLEDPKKIYAGAARWIELNGDTPAPYNSWKKNFEETYRSSLRTFPVGFGGTLYFPQCFHKDILNEEKFLELAPLADDIWYKCMSIMNGVRSKNINNKFSIGSLTIPVMKKQLDSLSMLNVIKGKNDLQLKKVLSHYPGVIKQLKDESNN